MRSSLAKYAETMREPDPAKRRELAKQAWHEHGILVVLPEDMGRKVDHFIVEGVARALYGKGK